MAQKESCGRPSVFFDVDNTLLTWNHRLRPQARGVIAELSALGCARYLGSGVGVRWEVVDVHGLRPFVTACFLKPSSRHRLATPKISVVPDHVVDDEDEVVEVFGGTQVCAPLEPLSDDGELLRVVPVVRLRFGL